MRRNEAARCHSAPGFASLVNDEHLSRYRMSTELGRVKNTNKNTVEDKAVREFEGKITHQQPQGGAITHVTLNVATAELNFRVRGQGLSARKLWTLRDRYTNRCHCPITSS